MYSDDVALTTDNVLAVLYLSQKYILSTLTQRCINFLEECLTPDTAPLLLEQSMLYGEKELMKKSLEIIEKEAVSVFASDGFLDVSANVLGEMLKLNLKVPSEVTVFEACMKWAKNQCQLLNISPSGENIREVLGNNLYLIRFPIMTGLEFTDVVASQNVLTDREGYQVLQYITSAKNRHDTLPFQTELRVKYDPSPRCLMTAAPYMNLSGLISNQKVIRKVTSLSCQISTSFRLRRVCVPANNNPMNVKQELTVTLNQNGKCLYHYTGQSFSIPGSADLLAVDVDDVLVEAGELELVIVMKLSKAASGFGWINYTLEYSSPETSQLSDYYVTITFPPVQENLLRGIEYRIP